MSIVLTVVSPFLGYTIGQQITDSTIVATIYGNPLYQGLYIASNAPGSSGSGGGTTPTKSATTLTSNNGPVSPDDTTVAITTGNVLYVIPSGAASSSIISALGYTPANVSSIGMTSGIASLDSSGHLPASQLTLSVSGAYDYTGTWNASTNTPSLMSSVGTKGTWYKVSVAGNTPIDGTTSWNIGDVIAFNGTTWDHFGGSTGPQVLSFNTRTGVITLTNTDIQTALGYVPYNSANPNSYVTAAQISANSPVSSFNTRTGAIILTTTDITNALTFTPYNATNPANFITLAQSIAGAAVKSINTRTGSVVINSADVIQALTYTPYDSANPAGYITLAQLPANTGAVSSVAGRTGAIILTTADISGLATVALSGSYTNLINRPIIATATSQLVNDALFITSGGAPVQSVNGLTGFVNLNTAQLTNTAGFLTMATTPVTSVNGLIGDVVLAEVTGTLVNLAVSSLTNDLGYIATTALPTTDISTCLVTVGSVQQTLASWLGQASIAGGPIYNITGGNINMLDGSVLTA